MKMLLRFYVFAFVLIFGNSIIFAQEKTVEYDPDAELKNTPDYFVFGNILRHSQPSDSVYFKNGYTLGFGSNLYKSKYVTIRFSIGYTQLSFDKDYFLKDYREDNKISDSISISFNAQSRKLISVSPEIKITPFIRKRFSPYIVTGLTGNLGFNTIIITAETNKPGMGLQPFIDNYFVNVNQYPVEQRQQLNKVDGRLSNKTSFMVNMGLGLDFYFVDNLGAFIEYKYSTELLSYKEPQWKYQTFNLGILIRY